MDALANNLLTTNVLGKIDLSKGDMQFKFIWINFFSDWQQPFRLPEYEENVYDHNMV